MQDEADEFAMKEDEEPRELFRRVTKLAVALRDHGSKDTDDNWIKRKFLKEMMPYHKAMSSVILQRPDFYTLSSSEVLDEFVAMRILDKTADNVVLRSQRAKKPNLALNAKVCVEEEKQDRRQGGALWQPSLFECSHTRCLAVHHDRGRAFGAEGVDPLHQV